MWPRFVLCDSNEPPLSKHRLNKIINKKRKFRTTIQELQLDSVKLCQYEELLRQLAPRNETLLFYFLFFFFMWCNPDLNHLLLHRCVLGPFHIDTLRNIQGYNHTTEQSSSMVTEIAGPFPHSMWNPCAFFAHRFFHSWNNIMFVATLKLQQPWREKVNDKLAGLKKQQSVLTSGLEISDAAVKATYII